MEGAVRDDWDDHTFESILEQVRTEGTIDARGVRISSERLKRILEAAPEDPDDPERSLLRRASFAGVTFEGAASFAGVTFQEGATFYDATFQGAAWFARPVGRSRT